jgi:hypothetical protein
MSLCIGLLARAGRLVALISIFCVFFRLLLICDVESALSMLALARSCCLQARRARRPCRVVQNFPDGWMARWAATSTMSGVVGGWGSSSGDWVARLPRGLIALL